MSELHHRSLTYIFYLCGYILSMLVANMLSGMPLFGAMLYLGVSVVVFFVSMVLSRRGECDPPRLKNEEEKSPQLDQVRCYRIGGQITETLTIAMEMTVFLLFAMMATEREQLLSTMLLSLASAVCAGVGGEWMARRSTGWKAQDPTWLTVGGVGIWGMGVLVFGLNLWLFSGALWLACLCLAAVSLGVAFCLRGLRRMEELIPDVSRFTGLEDRFALRRKSQRAFARMTGAHLALVMVIVLFFALGRAMPEDAVRRVGWVRPLMALLALAATIAALVAAMRYPLSRPYLERLRRYLRTREAGKENEALRKRVAQAVEEEYRQPWLTRGLILFLRLIFRFSLRDAEGITMEDTHSVIFLCNHGELFAPIVCQVYFPAPFRSWTVSLMMEDPEEVANYIYTNTFSRQKWLLPCLRMPLSRFIGRASVTVMRQIESIPVYRDSPMKLRLTVRQSIEALEAGDNILIFPEDTSKKYALTGVGELSPGFVMLAEAYWKSRHKKACILPVYASREKKTITFGQALRYEPENGFQEEQNRIVEAVRSQMLALAEM